MFARTFDHRLGKIYSKTSPLDRLHALAQAAGDLKKLRAARIPERWKVVVEIYDEQFGGIRFNKFEAREEKAMAVLFRNLVVVLKFLDAEDRLKCLNVIEMRASTLSDESYYGPYIYAKSFFTYLVEYGLTSLVGDAAVARFRYYEAQIRLRLSDKPPFLGHAIFHLAPAISNLESPGQTFCYDLLDSLCDELLSKYLNGNDSVKQKQMHFVYSCVIQQLAEALQCLPVMDRLDKRISNLRREASRLRGKERAQADQSIDKLDQEALTHLVSPNRRSGRNTPLSVVRSGGQIHQELMRRLRSRLRR